MSEMRHRAIFEADELFATARQFGQVRADLTRTRRGMSFPISLRHHGSSPL
ncbi:hypothetical protein ACFV5N_00195 [Streptomyces sp. NPDC059853]|uniref:hypothetical protein n=1 Tax=Streptomyces sp. NPDC059853 TaxID=3346973 RepID=UPI00365B2E03